jgi:heparan-alpha-glucosaminide N-acetyltransferase
MQNSLTTQRVLSIDAFRGITILVMIFVNELAGVQGIPAWMKHMPATADAMTFVDVVFPAFLFIVGMSIPFAIASRRAKGDSVGRLNAHILFRTLGLLVLGFFMVNAEGGYNEAAMAIPLALWSLLFYVGVILIWNVYTSLSKPVVYTLRVAGAVLLLVLAWLYRGGEDGTGSMTPQWWGILGLIGWAYLVACLWYQLVRGKLAGICAGILLCLGLYILGKAGVVSEVPVLGWIVGQGGHAIDTAIVLCGITASLIFFDRKHAHTNDRRLLEVLAFALILVAAAFLARPYYKISKIFATPSWAFYSAAICCVIFTFLYWLIDLKHVSRWTAFFKPAASNPLLTYIIPFILYAMLRLFHTHFPGFLYEGVVGIVWSMVFAVAIMALVIGLNKLKIRLQL